MCTRISVITVEVGSTATVHIDICAGVVDTKACLADIFMDTILTLFAIGRVRGVYTLAFDALIQRVGISIIAFQGRVAAFFVRCWRDDADSVKAEIVGTRVVVRAFQVTQSRRSRCAATRECRIGSMTAEPTEATIDVAGDPIITVRFVFTAAFLLFRDFVETGLGGQVAIIFCAGTAIITVFVV